MLANVTIGASDYRNRLSTSAIFRNKEKPRMISRNLKRFAASNGTVALVVTGMLVLVSGLTANAQSEDARSHRGLQGTWRVQVTVSDCQTGAVQRTFPALFAFAKGGTVTNTTAGQPPALFTPGFGVWRRTDDHNYSAVSESFVFSPPGVWIQTHRLTRAIELDRDADEFTDTINLEIFDTSGNLIATGCGTSLARRFE
jgi:hypothetical protein